MKIYVVTCDELPEFVTTDITVAENRAKESPCPGAQAIEFELDTGEWLRSYRYIFEDGKYTYYWTDGHSTFTISAPPFSHIDTDMNKWVGGGGGGNTIGGRVEGGGSSFIRQKQ